MNTSNTSVFHSQSEISPPINLSIGITWSLVNTLAARLLAILLKCIAVFRYQYLFQKYKEYRHYQNSKVLPIAIAILVVLIVLTPGAQVHLRGKKLTLLVAARERQPLQQH